MENPRQSSSVKVYLDTIFAILKDVPNLETRRILSIDEAMLGSLSAANITYQDYGCDATYPGIKEIKTRAELATDPYKYGCHLTHKIIQAKARESLVKSLKKINWLLKDLIQENLESEQNESSTINSRRLKKEKRKK